MKQNDVIHNFRLVNVTPADEVSAVLYDFVYEKTGTRLLWIDRNEQNKTFVAGFKTIPEDDTGAFHILEHSVLSSSQKYPVKELFIELIKGTYNTFLDAGTGIDNTSYLMSSRSEDEFLTLLDFEMDCVLHPLIYKDPRIFKQEGWHYELLRKEDQPVFKGVVFNEVKGGSSIPQAVLFDEMSRLLYPDSFYRFDCGGNPQHVPDLTYEQFLEGHRKFYHPSNCCIAVDGSINIEKVLEKLDRDHLSSFDKQPDPYRIGLQKPGKGIEKEVFYAVGPKEPLQKKTFFAEGHLLPGKSDRKKKAALDVLNSFFTEDQESPLAKALTASGLAQSVKLYVRDNYQTSVIILVSNSDADQKDKVRSAIRKTFEEAVSGGIDKQKLEAALNKTEFARRSRRSEGYVGIYNCRDAMTGWLYGTDPAENLVCGDLFSELRSELPGSFFEDLIREVFLEDPGTVFLSSIPSNTLLEEIQRQETERLAAAKAGWSEEDIDRIIRETRELIEWQKTPNTEEALAMIPTLDISKIERKAEENTAEPGEEKGVKTLRHNITDSGIVHEALYFNACDLDAEDLPYLSLLADLLGKLPAADQKAEQIQSGIQRNIGRFEVRPEFYTRYGSVDNLRAFLTVNTSFLAGNAAECADLIGKILTGTQFTDKNILRTALQNAVNAFRAKLSGRGPRSEPAVRARSYTSGEGAALEYTEGYEYYCRIVKMLDAFPEKADEVLGKLSALAKKLIVKERVTVSTAGNDGGRFTDLASSLPDGEAGPETFVCAPFGPAREAFQIPAAVSYSIKCGNIFSCGGNYNGSLCVLSKLISSNFLWQKIRMQGGAYGGGLDVFPNGDIIYNSFRDPTPGRSIDCFDAAEGFARQYLEENDDLSRIIIGAVSSIEPIRGPFAKMKDADSDHFCGITYQKRCAVREELLTASKQDLLEQCAVLEKVRETNAVCVAGARKHLDECGSRIDRILNL